MPILAETLSQPKPRRTLRLRPFLLGLAILPGAGLAFAFYRDPHETRALQTPQGILGITHGTKSFLLGANWQKLAIRLDPTAQNHLGGLSVLPVTLTPNSLMLWQNGGFGGNPTRQLTLLLSDGVSGEMRVDPQYTYSMSSPDTSLLGYDLSNYPRRGKSIRIRFSGNDFRGHPPTDLVVPNPAAGPFPTWTPDAVQTPRRVGKLDLFLDRFVAGATHLSKPDAKPNGPLTASTRPLLPYQGWSSIWPGPQGYLDLRFREQGQPAANDWQVEEVRISDATGNFWQPSPPTRSDLSPESLRIALGPLLLPKEPAYQVQLVVARQNNFPASEIVSIPNLTIPARGQSRPVKQFIHRPGCQIEVAQVLGRNSIVNNAWITRQSYVALRTTGDTTLYLVHLVKKIQDQWISQGMVRTNIYNGEAQLPLTGISANGTFTLNLAITPRHTVRFLTPALQAPAAKGN